MPIDSSIPNGMNPSVSDSAARPRMPRKTSKPTLEQAKLDACLSKRGMKLAAADIHSGRKARTAARREVTMIAMGQDLEW